LLFDSVVPVRKIGFAPPLRLPYLDGLADSPFAGDAMPANKFISLPAIELAPLLIGARFLVNGVGGVIVETEAYEADDPASHSFTGERPRNRAMFGPPLTAYVYRSYGVHWCFNIVTGPVGHGAAVLVRAIEPTVGLETMAERRRTTELRLLASGPGRLTEALGINIAHNGLPLDASPFELTPRDGNPDIVSGPRIGITKAADHPWRFGLRGSPFLSRPFRRAAISVVAASR
jgi:DNA-3-methyladenine glycosylase